MRDVDRNWNPKTRCALKAAEWREGRDVSAKIKWPSDLPPFEAARRILAEFGGLEFHTPQSIIEIKPFIHNDSLRETHYYEGKVGAKLFPIAEMTIGDTLDLLVDPEGHIYTLYPFHSLEPLASSFGVAVNYLVNGFKIDEAVMNDDLGKVGLAGKAWKWMGQE